MSTCFDLIFEFGGSVVFAYFLKGIIVMHFDLLMLVSFES